MNSLRTCRARKSSKKVVNTPTYNPSEKIISSLVLRMAKLEQRLFVQRYEISILESELEALR